MLFPATALGLFAGCFSPNTSPTDGTSTAASSTSAPADSSAGPTGTGAEDTETGQIEPTGTSTTSLDSTSSGADESGSTTTGETRCAPPPPGLVAWWRGQSDATDMAGSNDGVVHGSLGYGRAVVGMGFDFSGDDYLEVQGGTAIYPEGSFSVEAWLSTEQPSGNILSMNECGFECVSGVSNSIYSLEVRNGRVAFIVRASGTARAPGEIEGDTHIADGVFHHVAAIRDVESGLLRLYIDGTEDTQSPVSLSPVNWGPILDDDGSPDPLTVGARRVAGRSATENHFSGNLDEVSFYHRALSSNEVLSIWESGSAGKCDRAP